MTEETARQRTTRADEVQETRRRRKSSSDLMPVAYNMDIPSHLKDPDYNYFWAADRPGRIAQLTENDDWDFVEDPSIQTHDKDNTVNTRVRRNGGQGGSGQVNAYLLRKRKDYCEQDEKDRLAAMLRQQELRAQSQNFGGKDNLANDPNAYIPDEVKFSSGRLRRA